MATSQEIFFIKAAVNKGYIGQGAANYALTYQKQFAEKGQHIVLVNYLLAKKILTVQQVEEIKEICVVHLQKTMHKAIIANPNESNDVQIKKKNIHITEQLSKQSSKGPEIQYLGQLTATRKLLKKEVKKALHETNKYEASDYENTNENSNKQLKTNPNNIENEQQRKVFSEAKIREQEKKNLYITEKLDEQLFKKAEINNLDQSTTRQVSNQSQDETKKYKAPKYEDLPNLSSKQNTKGMQTGEIFGHYRIEKEIGRGGMGSVYKVYDTKLQRIVALKVISLEYNIKEKQRKRFLQEIKATAQLNHPNIVKVLESGETPQNYFTMEYLEGGTLEPMIARKPLKSIQAATIVQKISEALHYAHKHGIIHRDIKPSNIMFNINKEPKLMDFGLSKMLDVDDNLSKTGETLGTPAYMSPEQANGGEIGAASDVYSLGATLYEMLTTKQVFQGKSYYDTLHKVFHEYPISPREIQPDIPKDLQAICLKSLQKKIDNRYVSARSFAKDLKNFIEHKSVSARPTPKFVIISRSLKKYQTLLVALCLLFSFFIVGLYGYVQMVYQKHVYFLDSMYELQKGNNDLGTQLVFSGKLHNSFVALNEYFLIERVLQDQMPKFLFLHLLSFKSITLDEQSNIQNIKKMKNIYDTFVKNVQKHTEHRAYYYCNRGYLCLYLENPEKAYNNFRFALVALEQKENLTSEEKIIQKFCEEHCENNEG